MKIPVYSEEEFKKKQEQKEEIKEITITKDTKEEIIEQLGSECTRCNHCCSVDSGILFDEDIKRIAKWMKITKEEFITKYLDPHERFNTKCYKLKQIKGNKPYGPCILLNEKGCSVHEVKPKYCKLLSTASKQGEDLAVWFALKYFVNTTDPESVRQWAHYCKTHGTIPGGEIDTLIPDKDRQRRILNYEE